MAEIPAVQRFITEDEIAATLTRGSNIKGSKGRIYAYFKEKHSPREQADFLKDEYGIGEAPMRYPAHPTAVRITAARASA